MRKTNKSTLYDIFTTLEENINIFNFDFVLHGGLLLHKMVLPKDSPIISIICEYYATYILKHYGGNNCTVVFDNYSGVPYSKKSSKQTRRYKIKRSVDIQIVEKTEVTNRMIFFPMKIISRN